MKTYTDIRVILATRKMKMPKGVINEDIKITYFLPAQSMIFVNKMLPKENEMKLITPISPIL
jgi:hypothetical protein